MGTAQGRFISFHDFYDDNCWTVLQKDARLFSSKGGKTSTTPE
jgi:hypothetical protein